MAHHDFGIIEHFEENRWYIDYEPERYDCILVNMSLIDYIFENYLDELETMKTYICISTQVFCGLAESDVTLIPPEALGIFQSIVNSANSKLKSPELDDLLHKIEKAKESDRYMIHYGI